MAMKLSNNASSLLAGPIGADDTELSVAAEDAAKFPALGEDDWYPLTIVNSVGNIEIVRVIARAGPTMTVQRGMEGTTARAFDAGCRAELRLTAGALADALFSGSWNDLTDKPPNTPDATDEVKGIIMLATVAAVRSATAGDLAITAELIAAACEPVVLADAPTIAVDWSEFLVAIVTFGGNRAFDNPTNVKPGSTRYICVKGDTAVLRTLAFAANYKGDLPIDTVSSTSWLMIGLTALAPDHIVVTSCKAL